MVDMVGYVEGCVCEGVVLWNWGKAGDIWELRNCRIRR